MQKISSFYPLFIEIQQILKSYDLKEVTPTFVHAHQINISYTEFISPFLKVSLLH